MICFGLSFYASLFLESSKKLTFLDKRSDYLPTNHDLIAIVAKKKKLKKFSATSAVKAASRAVLGTPPPVKRAENKKHPKKDKHKRSLGKLVADADQG